MYSYGQNQPISTSRPQTRSSDLGRSNGSGDPGLGDAGARGEGAVTLETTQLGSGLRLQSSSGAVASDTPPSGQKRAPSARASQDRDWISGAPGHDSYGASHASQPSGVTDRTPLAAPPSPHSPSTPAPPPVIKLPPGIHPRLLLDPTFADRILSGGRKRSRSRNRARTGPLSGPGPGLDLPANAASHYKPLAPSSDHNAGGLSSHHPSAAPVPRYQQLTEQFARRHSDRMFLRDYIDDKQYYDRVSRPLPLILGDGSVLQTSMPKLWEETVVAAHTRESEHLHVENQLKELHPQVRDVVTTIVQKRQDQRDRAEIIRLQQARVAARKKLEAALVERTSGAPSELRLKKQMFQLYSPQDLDSGYQARESEASHSPESQRARLQAIPVRVDQPYTSAVRFREPQPPAPTPALPISLNAAEQQTHTQADSGKFQTPTTTPQKQTSSNDGILVTIESAPAPARHESLEVVARLAPPKKPEADDLVLDSVFVEKVRDGQGGARPLNEPYQSSGSGSPVRMSPAPMLPVPQARVSPVPTEHSGITAMLFEVEKQHQQHHLEQFEANQANSANNPLQLSKGPTHFTPQSHRSPQPKRGSLRKSLRLGELSEGGKSQTSTFAHGSTQSSTPSREFGHAAAVERKPEKHTGTPSNHPPRRTTRPARRSDIFDLRAHMSFKKQMSSPATPGDSVATQDVPPDAITRPRRDSLALSQCSVGDQSMSQDAIPETGDPGFSRHDSQSSSVTQQDREILAAAPLKPIASPVLRPAQRSSHNNLILAEKLRTLHFKSQESQPAQTSSQIHHHEPQNATNPQPLELEHIHASASSQEVADGAGSNRRSEESDLSDRNLTSTSTQLVPYGEGQSHKDRSDVFATAHSAAYAALSAHFDDLYVKRTDPKALLTPRIAELKGPAIEPPEETKHKLAEVVSTALPQLSEVPPALSIVQRHKQSRSQERQKKLEDERRRNEELHKALWKRRHQQWRKRALPGSGVGASKSQGKQRSSEDPAIPTIGLLRPSLAALTMWSARLKRAEELQKVAAWDRKRRLHDRKRWREFVAARREEERLITSGLGAVIDLNPSQNTQEPDTFAENAGVLHLPVPPSLIAADSDAVENSEPKNGSQSGNASPTDSTTSTTPLPLPLPPPPRPSTSPPSPRRTATGPSPSSTSPRQAEPSTQPPATFTPQLAYFHSHAYSLTAGPIGSSQSTSRSKSPQGVQLKAQRGPQGTESRFYRSTASWRSHRNAETQSDALLDQQIEEEQRARAQNRVLKRAERDAVSALQSGDQEEFLRNIGFEDADARDADHARAEELTNALVEVETSVSSAPLIHPVAARSTSPATSRIVRNAAGEIEQCLPPISTVIVRPSAKITPYAAFEQPSPVPTLNVAAKRINYFTRAATASNPQPQPGEEDPRGPFALIHRQLPSTLTYRHTAIDPIPPFAPLPPFPSYNQRVLIAKAHGYAPQEAIRVPKDFVPKCASRNRRAASSAQSSGAATSASTPGTGTTVVEAQSSSSAVPDHTSVSSNPASSEIATAEHVHNDPHPTRAASKKTILASASWKQADPTARSTQKQLERVTRAPNGEYYDPSVKRGNIYGEYKPILRARTSRF